MSTRDRVVTPRGSTRPRRPKKRRGITNIRPRRKAADPEFWSWQACPTVAGKKRFGQLHPTQEGAFAQAEGFRQAAQQLRHNPTRASRLRAAIDRSIDITFANTQNAKTRTSSQSRARRILFTFYRGDPAHEPDGFAALTEQQQREALNNLALPDDYDGPALSDISANTITTFVQLRQQLDQAGNGLADDIGFLRTTFKRNGYRDHENPVTLAHDAGLKLTKRNVNHGSHPTPEQIAAMLRHVLNTDRPQRQRHHDILYLLAATGMRNGELGRLRPMDITWRNDDPDQGGTITKNSPANRPGPGFGGKSGPKPFFFAPELSPVLARLTFGLAHDALICSSENVTNICARWRKRLNLPWLSAENLRNAFLQSTQALAGSDVAWRQAGHCDGRMLDRHYTTHDEHRAREASHRHCHALGAQ